MRRFSLFTSCWAVILTAGAAVALEPISADQARGLGNACPAPAADCDPLWEVYGGAVILRRDPSSAGPGFRFGSEAGVDVDVRRRIGERNQLQVRYFGIDDWADQQAIDGSQTWIWPFSRDFTGIGEYDSDLHSAEINLRSQRNDWLTILGGFRWVELQENLNYERNFDPLTIPIPIFPDITLPGFDLERDGRTQNFMYGGQIGADFLVWDRGGPFTLNTEMKAGIYSNLAKSNSRLETRVLGDILTEERNRHTGFLGELGITARYQLTDNLAVRGGYQMVWIEGIALADNQPLDNPLLVDYGDYGAFGDLDARGGLFYHGATVGGEFRW